MSKRSTSKKNRIHCKRVWLDDDELWQFNLAQQTSKLGTSDFIRQRCLRIVKHKRVEVGQIQLYQELGVLQYQCQQLIDQMQQSLSTGVCVVGLGNGGVVDGKDAAGNSRGSMGNGSNVDAERATAEEASARDAVRLLEQHLGSIKQLRQRLVKLDSNDGSSDGLDGDR